MTDHDIVFVADPCFPGGSSSSLAYEIKAAARAGLRVALRPIRASRLARRRIPNSKISAAISETQTPVLPRNLEVSCRLALYCHPYLLDEPLAGNPLLNPEHVGLIAHHPLVDRWGKTQYSADRAIQLVRDLFGKDLKILPVSETVRKSFLGSKAAAAVSPSTWTNLIDLDEWPRASRECTNGVSAETKNWNQWFAEELAEALAFYRPKALVFDGNMPYQGLLDAMKGVPELTRIWVRRGLWRRPDKTALQRGRQFDLVIEPREIAAIQGPAFENHDTEPVLTTPPILSVQPENGLSRQTARRVLGLDQEANLALVQLGAGSNFDMEPARDRILSTILDKPSWQVVELISPVKLTQVESLDARHRLVSVFPFAARTVPAEQR